MGKNWQEFNCQPISIQVDCSHWDEANAEIPPKIKIRPVLPDIQFTDDVGHNTFNVHLLLMVQPTT